MLVCGNRGDDGLGLGDGRLGEGRGWGSGGGGGGRECLAGGARETPGCSIRLSMNFSVNG